ncbi:MAG: hypothetical protein R3C56_07240 [Pirellulaceae bacterium]
MRASSVGCYLVGSVDFWGSLLWCVLLWGAFPISEVNGQVGLPPFINYGQAREQLIREVLIPGGVTDERVIEGDSQYGVTNSYR